MDIGYAGALIGGLLALLSPCSVMLLPAFFAYAFGTPTQLLVRTGVFFLGLIATLVPLGVLAGSLGDFISQSREVLVWGAGAIILVSGVVQLSGIRIPGISRGSSGEGSSPLAVFVLGAVYAVAGVCAGPVLGSVLSVAALGGSPIYGALMLVFYAIGMTIPLLVLALIWGRMGARGRAWLRPRTIRIGKWQNSWTMVISGLLSIGLAILLILTDGTASLGGVFTIGTQYAAESWVATELSAIDNSWFIVAAVVMLGSVLGAVTLRGRRMITKTSAASE